MRTSWILVGISLFLMGCPEKSDDPMSPGTQPPTSVQKELVPSAPEVLSEALVQSEQSSIP